VPALIVVAVALVLGIWVRVDGASQRWLWADEATTLLHAAGRTGPQLDAAAPPTFGALAAALRVPARGGAGAVVAALVNDDPQHPPAYYLVQRAWDDAAAARFGVRGAAIVLGFASLAAIAWFAFVLFKARAGLFALGIAAVSPFLVLYGRQLREYGMWCGLVALASGLLVLAVRRGGAWRWLAYAAASALALWTTPLSLLFAPAHAVYAFVIGGTRRGAAFAAAYALAVAAYLPWIVVMIAHRAQIESSNTWSEGAYSRAALAAKVLFTLASAFTDLAYADPRGVVAGALALLVLVAAAIVVVRADRGPALLLGALAVTTAGTLLAADLATGSHRAASARYLAPLVVIAIVVVAGALARVSTRVAVPVFAALVVLGAWSSAVAVASPVWWDNHGDSSLRDVAVILGRAGSPPVAYEGSCTGLLSLARIVPPGERVRCPAGGAPSIAPGWYVVSPSAALIASARKRGLAVVSAGVARDPSAAVRAFRGRGDGGGDEPTIDRVERAGPGNGTDSAKDRRS
jgi:uncharacterized membrane protein